MTKFSAPQQNQLAQIGAFLRESREKQAKSLEDIAIRTYIRPQLLNGIETGNPDTLPEPIFVQGFIRRYAESLGLNGVELSQQFTVTSIPSTPRPARQAPPVDSPTTRFTRTSNGVSAPPASKTSYDTSIPMFSAGGDSPFSTDQSVSEEDLLRLGQTEQAPLFESNPDFDRADATPAETGASTSDSHTSNSHALENSTLESGIPVHNAFDGTDSDIASVNPTNDASANTDFRQQLDAVTLSTSESADDDFASKIAAFDQANLNQPNAAQTDIDRSEFNQPNIGTTGLESAGLESISLESTSLEKPALNDQSAFETTGSNAAFDDDLPVALTTEAEPYAPQTSREPMPVGVDYGDQPNLKPFIIGGVLAAIAVLALLVASVIGGGNRQPQVADTADTIEPAEPLEEVAELPELPEESVPATPAVSTAPVFVEATATAEAWVSVIADDTTLFEGTLQPGDTEVWEAQENLNIYSGDAGALELAANGGEAEVMGDRGQPEEKIFTQ